MNDSEKSNDNLFVDRMEASPYFFLVSANGNGSV